jgi:EpsI family protein
LGDWEQVGPGRILSDSVAGNLNADDYHSVTLSRAQRSPSVGLFMAWYEGPEPGRRTQPRDLPAGFGLGDRLAGAHRHRRQMGTETPFNINRAIIQQNDTRMMVYYWFQQGERRIAWDFAAKFYLMVDGSRRVDRRRAGAADHG